VLNFKPEFMTHTTSIARSYSSRSPKRLTITIPYSTFEAIVQRSNEEGRSLSNLAAFLLEQATQK
jgi:hypothetical protein